KMLIDAAHPEETRVVVLRGNRVEEFDFESAQRRQLRGNIYLAKVTRVEPSLQAAFVDYGGNRHGFLAFSEIHPDYYQIPVADRQALIEEEERAHRAAEAEAERRADRGRSRSRPARQPTERIQEVAAESVPDSDEALLLDAQADEAAAEEVAFAPDAAEEATLFEPSGELLHADIPVPVDAWESEPTEARLSSEMSAAPEEAVLDADLAEHDEEPPFNVPTAPEDTRAADADGESHAEHVQVAEDEEIVESVGGADALEEVADRMPRARRQYKIQEVIKRRQVLLVQVVKEERGTKGAALTTYLSLAGRYCVLMPNPARGGGISRKITDARDRMRLKEVAQDLEVPEGMGVILRTAGASRTKLEIKRDFEYLLRVWETVRDLTLRSTAPTLVYEEGSLVKRALRDLYTKDIDEIAVAGDQAYAEAREFMRMLMPSHVRNVRFYRDNQPLFSRYGIESQLDAMFSPVVQLRSGGYIVLNQTEALVSIDVNSGRATREHHIEDTALKTNLEACDEVARQLRLRDLAGLIVIDFIDMDEKRNNRSVERRLKDALKNDRARIQVGRISHFGLMEMSRQRIRASVLESSTDKCALCGGTGHVRSVASVALQLLRVIEETLLRGATHNQVVRTRSDIALYLLNHKRAHLRDLEQRFQITITVNADAGMAGQQPFLIERGEQVHTVEQARAIAQQVPAPAIEEPEEEEPQLEVADEPEVEAEAEADEGDAEEVETFEDAQAPAEEMRGEAGPGGRGRRRRRRRGRRGGEPRGLEAPIPGALSEAPTMVPVDGEETGEDEPEDQAPEAGEVVHAGHDEGGDGRKRRRRGRRGGRRNRRGDTAMGQEAYPAHPVDEAPLDEASGINFGPAESEPAIEPELATAVADFGGPAVALHQPRPEETVAHPASEAPRRRSTVREAVTFPVESSGATSPAPTEAEMPAHPPEPLPEPASETASKPRRTGWWAKRLLGG
ncbi:MAG: Rne/Rng family ribonuclease, partial [Xanthobacteraceae bacterium]|nr:Rne/Rng family ribonuclease [Xanthobacteraceae bacterium]